MFTRFFNAKIRSGKEIEFQHFFTDEILPALQRAPGCLYASLIQSTEDSEDFISFSLWDAQGSIRAWEQSSRYTLLLHKSREFFVGSTEWRVQLTKELKLEYTPVLEEPIVRAYREATAVGPHELSQAIKGPMHVRLASAKVAPEKMGEFEEIYKDEIMQSLHCVDGCRYAFLVDAPAEGEIISVTIWESKNHADAYERSGIFESLVEKVRHTFSPIYQWKMRLAEQTQGATVTSADLTVKPYQVVVARQLG
jgi:heme-degrading monooxygenase HmoA